MTSIKRNIMLDKEIIELIKNTNVHVKVSNTGAVSIDENDGARMGIRKMFGLKDNEGKITENEINTILKNIVKI